MKGKVLPLEILSKQNGADLTELARDGNGGFFPYKIWMSDLWECQDCGTIVAYVADHHGQQPLKHKHQPGFEEQAFQTMIKAKEWTRG